MNTLARLAAALALLLAALAAPAVVHAEPRGALQEADARVQSIGWRLARGNARYCPRVAPSIGLQLQDAMNYADPAAARAALGLTGDIAVQAVAEGSPAAAAGLEANDALLSVAGIDVTRLPPAQPGDWRRLQDLHQALDAALAATGEVTLTVIRDGAPRALTIRGERVCVARFELQTGQDSARAGDQRVLIGQKQYEAYTADEQIASTLAHELAHLVLDHQARLKASGRRWDKVRATEIEADRLAAWLLHNGGFEAAALARFMKDWGPRNDYGIFSHPDHPRWPTRLRLIEAELARLAAAIAADPAGEANWARDFVR